MTQTREAFLNAVAVKSKRLPLGQTLSAEDYAELDAIVDSALAEIAQLEVFYVGDTQEFEDGSFGALKDAVATYDPMFVPTDGVTIEQAREAEFRRLRKLGKSGPQYYVMKAEYF